MMYNELIGVMIYKDRIGNTYEKYKCHNRLPTFIDQLGKIHVRNIELMYRWDGQEHELDIIKDE